MPHQCSRSSAPRARRRAGGVALVEFAIILMPLTLMTIGAAAVGELVRVQLIVDTAAREAARVAAATRPPVEGDLRLARGRALQAADGRARSVLDGAGLRSVDTLVSLGDDFSRDRGAGDPALATVTVQYTHLLSPGSLAVLRHWFPGGEIRLKGVAHETIPRYLSAWP